MIDSNDSTALGEFDINNMTYVNLCLTDTSPDGKLFRVVEVGHKPMEDPDAAVNDACKKIEDAFSQWEALHLPIVDSFLKNPSKWFVLYGSANIKEFVDIIECIHQIDIPEVQQVFKDNDIVFKVQANGTVTG